jgi:hypothetical protein
LGDLGIFLNSSLDSLVLAARIDMVLVITKPGGEDEDGLVSHLPLINDAFMKTNITSIPKSPNPGSFFPH